MYGVMTITNCSVVLSHSDAAKRHRARAAMSYYVAAGGGFCHAQEMGERVFLVAAIAIGIIVPVVGALYAAWMLMH